MEKNDMNRKNYPKSLKNREFRAVYTILAETVEMCYNEKSLIFDKIVIIIFSHAWEKDCFLRLCGCV